MSLLSILFLSSLTFAQSSEVSKCQKPPKFYEDAHYTVHEVKIDVPLKWLGSVNANVEKMLAALPLQKGNPFNKVDSDAGVEKLQKIFPELEVSPNARIATRFTPSPVLRNCDEARQTLDVVYHVYTLGFANYLTRTFESRPKEVSRSVVETPTTRRLAKYSVQPYVGYNRSRNLFGGTKFSVETASPLLEKLSLEASGSSSSSTVKAEVAGAHDSDTRVIAHSEWHLEYVHSDVPSNNIDLKQGWVRGQFSAATRARGSRLFVMRFGGAIEGGNKQTNLAPTQILPTDLARSGYGSVKMFVGGTMKAARQTFKTSYAVQVGNADGGHRIDYVKQIFDTAHTLRFLPAPHRPITVESQFTAGHIHLAGRLPVAERFFGGNAEQNFIAGETWVIRSNPFIRSFPQNRLAQTGAAGFVGGDRFFSANLTLAATVWGYPLVPNVVLKDPELDDKVKLALSASQGILMFNYLSKEPQFIEIAESLTAVKKSVDALTVELNKIPQPNPDEDIDNLLQALFQRDVPPEQKASGKMDRVKRVLERVVADLKEEKANPADIETLALPVPSDDPEDEPLPSFIEDLNRTLARLTALQGIPNAAEIDRQSRLLHDMAGTIQVKYADLLKSPAADVAKDKAARDMVYPRHVIRALMFETNLIGVSPVAIFDAARIWQRGQRAGDVRYAVGGGVRINFINLELTTGYAWNPHPKPWEGRGAFVFSMQIPDMFR